MDLKTKDSARGSAHIVNPLELRYPYELPELPYAHDALEPHLDTETMKLHHGKHHAAYVNNLNKALETHPELQSLNLQELLLRLDELPDNLRAPVLNNGGGHLNHAIFWKIMSPSPQRAPSGDLASAVDSQFGDLQGLLDQLRAAALSVFGSGWAWLVSDSDGMLHIKTYPNQNPPLLDGFVPLVGIDVWEHTYYLKFQNRRGDFITAFYEVLDWLPASQVFSKTSQAS